MIGVAVGALEHADEEASKRCATPREFQLLHREPAMVAGTVQRFVLPR
jgi:hypothetical protein